MFKNKNKNQQLLILAVSIIVLIAVSINNITQENTYSAKVKTFSPVKLETHTSPNNINLEKFDINTGVPTMDSQLPSKTNTEEPANDKYRYQPYIFDLIDPRNDQLVSGQGVPIRAIITKGSIGNPFKRKTKIIKDGIVQEKEIDVHLKSWEIEQGYPSVQTSGILIYDCENPTRQRYFGTEGSNGSIPIGCFDSVNYKNGRNVLKLTVSTLCVRKSDCEKGRLANEEHYNRTEGFFDEVDIELPIIYNDAESRGSAEEKKEYPDWTYMPGNFDIHLPRGRQIIEGTKVPLTISTTIGSYVEMPSDETDEYGYLLTERIIATKWGINYFDWDYGWWKDLYLFTDDENGQPIPVDYTSSKSSTDITGYFDSTIFPDEPTELTLWIEYYLCETDCSGIPLEETVAAVSTPIVDNSIRKNLQDKIKEFIPREIDLPTNNTNINTDFEYERPHN